MTTKTRPARVRTSNITGEVICAHRNQSCCPACFARTPNLIDVYGVVYHYHHGDWEGVTMDGLTLSPGTVTDA
jgi:hypothetical protein